MWALQYTNSSTRHLQAHSLNLQFGRSMQDLVIKLRMDFAVWE
jgi:hypothetical protein